MMKKTLPFLLLFLFLFLSLLLLSCEKKTETLFKLIRPEDSGIDFVNEITESDTFNILTEEYIYNGGGVGVGDFNNDGRADLFFTGNMVTNRLYVNKGDLKFQDITADARLTSSGVWSSGVSVVDINSDGWEDIYVCTTMWPDSNRRRNLLYINEGLNSQGIPTFSEAASKYGLDDAGYCMMSAFFDYDRDGDLDVYLLINQRLTGVPTNYRDKVKDGSSPNNDKLYRNNGDNSFTDVSKESGINIEGFGLGLAVSDFNADGWPDLYISNDFLSNDILYLNNTDGTFSNATREFIGHQSQFSMGNDAADINNDGLPDIISLDMLPETNARKKTTIGNKSYQTYINNEKFGYEYQYVRNMLHLNNNAGAGIRFSEVGQLAGVYQTEWSWSPLFADFNNDGHRDLFITNGFPKDITDKDFANYRAELGNIAGPALLVDSIPVIKIPNYAFKNNGDITFSDYSKTWGLDQPSFSNGAVFADLDNDGDLDYVVNNIDDPAFVYENRTYAHDRRDSTHYLQLKLVGMKKNSTGRGAKVKIIADGKPQFHEQQLSRGYLSSVDAIVHFGLGSSEKVDTLLVSWPDGTSQLLTNVKADQRLDIAHSDRVAIPASHATAVRSHKGLLTEVSRKRELAYVHFEEDKIDYNVQRTLPHKFTQYGPGMAVGDINSDGAEDLIIGGPANHPTTVFIQRNNGKFSHSNQAISTQKKHAEDQGMLLFDADGDNDLDLYAVSGGGEYKYFEPQYQDRLYSNDGKGNFIIADDALPKINASGSCVRAADFDSDGDLDLFVGGRVVPGQYPYPAESYLLRNEKGKFTNVVTEFCPELSSLGMVTDAIWSDMDNDNRPDLLVVGEFMAITVFQNTGKGFKKLADTGLEKYMGWWNSITGADFDRDGDIDYVSGNFGLNNSYCATTEYPLKVYAKDFDKNESVDAVLACYLKESLTQLEGKKLYPVHFWDELNSQSPKFRQQFSSYKQYGKTTMGELLSPDDLKDAVQLEANFMSSAFVENLGGSKFRLSALPTLAQVAPVNGIATDDINGDGNLDILLVGNDYGNEIFVGRMDALTGLTLFGDGKGGFSVGTSAETGFKVPGDAKALVKITSTDATLYIASQNRDSLRVYENMSLSNQGALFTPLTTDVSAELIYTDGKKQKVEFYYGSGFLSQSTRKIRIPKEVKEAIIFDSRGKSRTISLNNDM